MSIDAFLAAAWADHADHPQDVADRLAASVHLLQAPEHFAPFAHLLTHVCGEHLGQWQRGVEQLESLRDLPALGGDAAASAALVRGIATLRYASGDTAALDALSCEDRIRALAIAASALAERNDVTRAITAYTEALRVTEAGLPAASPAIRTLAAGGNNLATTLERKSGRTVQETQSMLTAAEAALKAWKQAGTWLEEERAEYRLARSRLQAGEPVAAQRSAQRCVDICYLNDAPAFERFFAHAVLALACRAAGNADAFQLERQAAMGHFDQLADDEKKWCEDECRELQG
jgi:tetratricopeptide (TPR) repeat protein